MPKGGAVGKFLWNQRVKGLGAAAIEGVKKTDTFYIKSTFNRVFRLCEIDGKSEQAGLTGRVKGRCLHKKRPRRTVPEINFL